MTRKGLALGEGRDSPQMGLWSTKPAIIFVGTERQTSL